MKLNWIIFVKKNIHKSLFIYSRRVKYPKVFIAVPMSRIFNVRTHSLVLNIFLLNVAYFTVTHFMTSNFNTAFHFLFYLFNYVQYISYLKSFSFKVWHVSVDHKMIYWSLSVFVFLI